MSLRETKRRHYTHMAYTRVHPAVHCYRRRGGWRWRWTKEPTHG